MIIESVNNEKVKLWKKIRTKKYIDEYKEYIVEGEHLVEEAIKSGCVKELIILDGYNYDSLLPKCFVSEKVMNTISLMKSVPYVMAVVRVREDNNEFGNKIMFLDDVQDPGNVGTIIRTAVAFNFDTIILTDNSASLYNDKVIRASQGMIFNINVITGEKKEILNKLKEKDYEIYITKMDGEYLIEETKNEKIVFVLGNEGAGVSDEAKSYATSSVRIPMNDNCESLNVAITGAIIMYVKR